MVLTVRRYLLQRVEAARSVRLDDGGHVGEVPGEELAEQAEGGRASEGRRGASVHRTPVPPLDQTSFVSIPIKM